jgi:catechol 2,3-dioxygenase-like lactoylglutathione lyase family enzyme
MLHHVDVHVREIGAARALFGTLAEHVGYRELAESDGPAEPGVIGYETVHGGRPRIGLIPDRGHRAGSTRLAFAVPSRQQVDAVAQAVRDRGARAIEGPCVHPEYGDYYAVFFEDADGNKYEVVVDEDAVSAAPLAALRAETATMDTDARVAPATVDAEDCPA